MRVAHECLQLCASLDSAAAHQGDREAKQKRRRLWKGKKPRHGGRGEKGKKGKKQRHGGRGKMVDGQISLPGEACRGHPVCGRIGEALVAIATSEAAMV